MGISYSGLMLLNREKITIGVFFILFLLRASFTFFSERIWGDYAFFYQLVITIPLLILVIWSNQKSLYSIFIDRSFIFIFALTCFLLCFYYWGTYLEIILLVALLFGYVFLISKDFVFIKDETSSHTSVLFLAFLGAVGPLLLLGTPYYSSHFQGLFLLSMEESVWIIATRLSTALYEVILFWGISSIFLNKWKVHIIGIFIIQVFSFWLAYINLYPSSIFWVTAPLMGLWLGFTTSYSKSLTPGVITFFTYNLIMATLHLTPSL